MKSLTIETSFLNIPLQQATPEFEVIKYPNTRPLLCMTDNGDLENTVFNQRTVFMFHFQEGTSYPEAAALQEFLEKHVEKVSVMGF